MQYFNPLTSGQLQSLFKDVKHPAQKIKYLRSKGEIQGIMRGWYLYKPDQTNFSKLHTANLLYGPSYISSLSALSYYGLILDRTAAVESIVFKRSKKLSTKIGTFIYHTLPRELFSLGINRAQYDKNLSFLIASPTKALFDHFYISSNLTFTGKDDLLQYLEEDLRFDTSSLIQLDVELLERLATFGKKERQVRVLIALIEKLT